MGLIAYISPYIPAEWIAAHGLRPSRSQPAGTAPNGPIPPTAGICPFMRSFANETTADANVDGIIMTTVCDQMRRGYELVQATGKPTFCFNVPSTWQTDAAMSLYRNELQRLGRFLVSLGGTAPDSHTLAITMRAFEAQRQLPPPTSPPNTIPLAITGGPRTKLDERLLDLITSEGGRIVLDATEMGLLGTPALFNPESTKTNPLHALAEAYFYNLPGISRRPNTTLLTWLATHVERTGAKGVVLLRYLCCDLWHAEVARIRDVLSVPLLDIDLDGEDPVPRNQTRIQAFLEGLH